MLWELAVIVAGWAASLAIYALWLLAVLGRLVAPWRVASRPERLEIVAGYGGLLLGYTIAFYYPLAGLGEETLEANTMLRAAWQTLTTGFWGLSIFAAAHRLSKIRGHLAEVPQ